MTAEEQVHATRSKKVDEIIESLKKDPIERTGHVYHPIPFEEFAGLTTSTNRQEAEKKLSLTIEAIEMIRPEGVAGARVLDVGARGGYHTFSLDQLGAEVTAFEPHPRYAQIGSVLAEEKARSVTWHPSPLDFSMIEGEKFDVTLMLSVFQWMAAGGGMEKALNELFSVSEISSAMIFELGFNHGRSAIQTRKKNHYSRLIDLLRESTCYTHFRFIGKTRVWRGGTRFMVLCSDVPKLDDNLLRKILRRLRI